MAERVDAYIAIGSNIAPEVNIPASVAGMVHLGALDGISSFYSTPAIGRSEQPRYANGVVRIRTGIGAAELRLALRAIEAALGRGRTADKYASRTIDLDLVLYGDRVIADLGIPDPDIGTRPFLAIPIRELDPKLIVPGLDMPISSIAASFAEIDLVPLDQYPGLIRNRLEELGLPVDPAESLDPPAGDPAMS